MPPREFAGPAGRIEALLEEPMAPGTIGHDGRVSPGHPGGLRAAVVFGHPHTEFGGTMHTKVVYQARQGAQPHRLRRAPLQLSRRRRERRHLHQRTGRDGRLPRRARLHAGAVSGRADAGRRACRSERGSRSQSAPRTPRVTTLIGIAPPVTRYDFDAVATSTKPKFFIQGEFDELCFLKEMKTFYARAAEPKELVVIDGADHLFDGKVSEVADAIEELLGDWQA